MTILPSPDPVLESITRLAPDVCVCLVCDGGDDLGIAGVVDFATAEAWRIQDTAHRAFMMFRYGKLDDDLDLREDEEEAEMNAPILPAPVIPKRSK